METTSERWERFLDPDAVRPSRFLATMFITTFEILKSSVVDRIRDFYADSWEQSGSISSSKYDAEVTYRHKSLLYASLEWLKEQEAIDNEDLERFEQLKKTRNMLAHQLFEVVTGQIESKHEAQFAELVELLRKIEVWWILNVEIPTNPDFDGQEIDAEDIKSGSILALQMLIEVASGNSELLEKWRKARTQNQKKAT